MKVRVGSIRRKTESIDRSKVTKGVGGQVCWLGKKRKKEAEREKEVMGERKGVKDK